MSAKPLLITDPTTYDYIFDGHSGAGPSGAERWMNCTASLQASREFLETLTPTQQQVFARAGEAARQGTTAHAAAEAEARLMLGQIDQADLAATLLELSVMPDTDGESYSEEMGTHVTEYLDLVRSYADDHGAENVLIEARLSAPVELTGEHAGTEHTITGSGDCVVLPGGTKETNTLVVIDFKYGNGYDVDVDSNPQVRIYGLGALALLISRGLPLPERIVYYISQPRLGGTKMWSESITDLLDWRDSVLAPALTLALYGIEGGAEFNPGESQCQWCPARGNCTALAEARVEAAADLFDAMTEYEYEHGPGGFASASTLSDERLGQLLEQIVGLLDIHADLKEEAQRRLLRGKAVPGFKLVSYTPPRKWKPEAADTLPSKAPVWKPKTLVTPTQALRVIKDGRTREMIESLIDTPAKRPVVAPEHDRRRDWTGALDPEQMFTDETD